MENTCAVVQKSRHCKCNVSRMLKYDTNGNN